MFAPHLDLGLQACLNSYKLSTIVVSELGEDLFMLDLHFVSILQLWVCVVSVPCIVENTFFIQLQKMLIKCPHVPQCSFGIN